MKNYRKTLVSCKQVESVVCNMCGNEIEKNPFGYIDEHLSVEKTWGYGSPYDGETHEIDICGHCYEKLLGQLKIKPGKCCIDK